MFEDSRSRNIKFIKTNTEVLSLYCVAKGKCKRCPLERVV